MVIRVIKKDNESRDVNSIDKAVLTIKVDQISSATNNKNNETKNINQQVKVAQYYKKIDPTYLSMLNAQSSKKFITLFRNALTVKLG